MKILILGAGKMGSFFTDLLSFDHEVAVLERDPKRMRFIYNAIRMQQVEEVKDFAPELVINCVTLNHTIDAFKEVLPYLQPYCIIADIASVKTHLKEFYDTCGFPYVSTHPMFGPTFAPDVWADFCQSGKSGEGKYHYHLGRRSSGKDLLQRLIQPPASEYP